MSIKYPFFQFYPSDWIRDTQVLSLEAQGAWMKILCRLHDAPKRGVYTWTVPELEQYLGYPEDGRALNLIGILQRVASMVWKDGNEKEVYKLDDAVFITIKSRRMVRDDQRLSSRSDSQKTYRDKQKTPKRPREDPEKIPISHKSEVISQKKKKKGRNAAGAFPTNFEISEGFIKLCGEKGWGNPYLELDRFKDYHAAKGNKFVDWEAALRNWMRKTKEFTDRDSGGGIDEQLKEFRKRHEGKEPKK